MKLILTTSGLPTMLEVGDLGLHKGVMADWSGVSGDWRYLANIQGTSAARREWRGAEFFAQPFPFLRYDLDVTAKRRFNCTLLPQGQNPWESGVMIGTSSAIRQSPLGPFPVQPTPEGVTGHLAYNKDQQPTAADGSMSRSG